MNANLAIKPLNGHLFVVYLMLLYCAIISSHSHYLESRFPVKHFPSYQRCVSVCINTLYVWYVWSLKVMTECDYLILFLPPSLALYVNSVHVCFFSMRNTFTQKLLGQLFVFHSGKIAKF